MDVLGWGGWVGRGFIVAVERNVEACLLSGVPHTMVLGLSVR